MTYEAQSVAIGRQQVWIVELHMKSCSLEFGVGACPATGTPCFNTEATCPVFGSFVETEKIYRFIEPVENMPLKSGFIPSLKSVSITPGAIKVGGGLGTRAVASISFFDHPHSDIGIDPYRDTRSYEPFDQGTFWGKFRARNPYYLGNLVRIYHGYITNNNITSFNYNNAISMDFYIESISQPSSGTVTIVGKDPLKAADDKRALAPRLNSGMMQSSITAAVGQVITLLPAGVGNLEYETSGTVIMAGECAEFTRTGDAMTLTVRGVRGTTAQAHDAETAVQQVLIYRNTAAEICQDLLETYADVDPSLIRPDEWNAECDSYLPFLYDAFMVKPTPVKDLITALGTESPFDIFWNERRNVIEFKAVKSPPLDAPVWDDNKTFLESDVSLSDAPDMRVSTVIINFDVINPAGDLEDPNNYRQTHVAIDTDSVRRYGGQVVKTINSKFLSASNRAAAEFAASVYMARFADVPIKLSANIDPKDGGVWTGDCVFVDHYKIQDATGANAVTPYQVTSVTQKGESLDYDLITYGNVEDVTTEFLIILDDEYIDLRSATTEMHLPPLTLRELFDRRFSTEPDTRTVRVRIGVNGILGHRDNSYAIIINDAEWPVATPIIIEIEDGGDTGGYVVGRGGDGAVYITPYDSAPEFAYNRVAKDGGNAIFTDRPITILNNGVIGAGGGGGGCAIRDGGSQFFGYGFGGGGGAGYPEGNYTENWYGEIDGKGSINNGGGGSTIGYTTGSNDCNATISSGGNGQNFVSGTGGGGGGGGGLTTPGSGGTGSPTGNNGTVRDGGDGVVHSSVFASAGGGGALGGSGGASGTLSGASTLYTTPGSAGIAIDGIAYVTIDPLSTGVIIGATV